MANYDKKKKDKLGVIIITIILIIFLIIGVFYYILTRADSVDKETLCPENKSAAVSTVVIIDKSDKWENDDVSRIEDWLNEIYKQTPAFERLTFIAITGESNESVKLSGMRPDSTEVKKLFDMCNPGSEEECNALYENCRKIRKKYESAFSAPLTQIIKLLKIPSESSYSPLFETLVQVVSDNKSPKLNIHLISDLMENGSKFRFYDVIPLADEISEEYSIVSDSEINIHVHLIERRRHSRELLQAVKSVWYEYCAKQKFKFDFASIAISN